MSKKAIYLDARERKLVRDVFNVVTKEISDSLRQKALCRHESMALDYTRVEMATVIVKFEEQAVEEDSVD